jgi:hypothetical protein
MSGTIWKKKWCTGGRFGGDEQNLAKVKTSFGKVARVNA